MVVTVPHGRIFLICLGGNFESSVGNFESLIQSGPPADRYKWSYGPHISGRTEMGFTVFFHPYKWSYN